MNRRELLAGITALPVSGGIGWTYHKAENAKECPQFEVTDVQWRYDGDRSLAVQVHMRNKEAGNPWGRKEVFGNVLLKMFPGNGTEYSEIPYFSPYTKTMVVRFEGKIGVQSDTIWIPYEEGMELDIKAYATDKFCAE